MIEVIDIVNEVAAVTADANPMEKVFIPDWTNKPPEYPPILSLNGVGVLTHQNLSAIIAAQGMGKSSICEAILSSYLNGECDALGWEVDPSISGAIYVDFERTNTDVWNSFNRMARRAGIKYGQEPKNVKLVGMRSIPRLEQRKAALIQLLDIYPCSLLILDGAGDLITDSNDLPQAIECRIWIRELTVTYNVSIFTTLHPNPGGLKPRGHVGSEIMREAEAVMAVVKQSDIRVIMSEFEHGKNRNGAPIWGAYAWDDNEMMHCSRQIPDFITNGDSRPKNKQAAPDEIGDDTHIKMIHQMLAPDKKLKSEDLYKELKMIWENDMPDKMSKTRAIQFKKHYLANQWIRLDPQRGVNNEQYHMIDPSIMFIDGLYNEKVGLF